MIVVIEDVNTVCLEIPGPVEPYTLDRQCCNQTQLRNVRDQVNIGMNRVYTEPEETDLPP